MGLGWAQLWMLQCGTKLGTGGAAGPELEGGLTAGFYGDKDRMQAGSVWWQEGTSQRVHRDWKG